MSEENQSKKEGENEKNEETASKKTEGDNKSTASKKKQEQLNHEVLNKGKVTINTSSSKQMYSFSRAERFKYNDRRPIVEFYNLPSYIGKKGTSIGYGCKTDFTKSVRGRNQAIYNVPRDFDLNSSSISPKYTFGASRETCKVPVDHSRNSPNSPSPCSYNPYKPLGYDAQKNSLYSRRYMGNKAAANSPGPGAYSYMNINPNGRYAQAGFNNVSTSRFGNDHSQRSGQKFSSYPGPGSYETKTRIDGKGSVYDSSHISCPGKSMGMKLSLAGSNIVTPGPGSYNFFSDFEGFQKGK
ncbi:MAG: hypothetical protein MJ252_10435 [archaeon]|nr:hypothetical protein [archaeon]